MRTVAPYPRPYMLDHNSVRAEQFALLARGHLSTRMEHWAASGAENRLVYRYPLLDRRIVEFCLGIPSDQFFKTGWKRHLFRAATAGLLPHEVCWKKNKYDPAERADRIAKSPEATERIVQWLAERENDPDWGHCADLRQIRRALSNDEPQAPGVRKALSLEIVYHNQRMRRRSARRAA